MERYSHPAAGLQHAIVLLEASLHDFLVLNKPFALDLVLDGLFFVVGKYAMPDFPQKIQFGVHQVASKRRIGEGVIHNPVRQ